MKTEEQWESIGTYVFKALYWGMSKSYSHTRTNTGLRAQDVEGAFACKSEDLVSSFWVAFIWVQGRCVLSDQGDLGSLGFPSKQWGSSVPSGMVVWLFFAHNSLSPDPDWFLPRSWGKAALFLKIWLGKDSCIHQDSSREQIAHIN